MDVPICHGSSSEAAAASDTGAPPVTQNLAIAAVFITGLAIWDLVAALPLPLDVASREGSTSFGRGRTLSTSVPSRVKALKLRASPATTR
ncbi:hypothetical protein [Pseudofrankia sp. BMG5.37]|uniref:hypothetical protein n=1 Tax=Pseudofrankia sp. BMG5.37 TaxID=3050035 RepID=UPI002894A22B|nr:hypothetical protein [Pseudofrankia sp. BMG5.37]MDT3446395.1 hypothetical protein [Pseudofrankia sp. BMG5.37]